MAIPLLIIPATAAAVGIAALMSSKGCAYTTQQIGATIDKAGNTIDKTTNFVTVLAVGFFAYYFFVKK